MNRHGPRPEHRVTVQSEAVDVVLGHEPAPGPAIEAVVAAADAPTRFLLEFPLSGRFLLTVRRSELLGSKGIPAEIADDLSRLDRSVADLLIRLSRAMWDRADRDAVAVIRDCAVELPTALLPREPCSPSRTTSTLAAIKTTMYSSVTTALRQGHQ